MKPSIDNREKTDQNQKPKSWLKTGNHLFNNINTPKGIATIAKNTHITKFNNRIIIYCIISNKVVIGYSYNCDSTHLLPLRQVARQLIRIDQHQ